MSKTTAFQQAITSGYEFKGKSILLGAAMLDGEVCTGLHVKAPLRTFNRHGLIAGATGTGKTKTLQMIAEQLSQNGVPVLLMDIKGDLSGIAAPGTANARIDERSQKIGSEWQPLLNPTELLSISDEPGTRMRATVSEFGPVLLSKILGVNDTQAGVLSLVFKYADDNDMPLLDIKDLRKMLQYITTDGKADIEKHYGLVSSASTGAILRSLITIEEQGAEKFFGEPSFDVDDLMRRDEKGRGMVNIIRLTDVQNKPRLFSTFMLCLLAEVYEKMPETGDPEQPELVIFMDEAHLIFREASKALLEQIETVIKLIRSKGVGVFFVTQTPGDIPNAVLSQLGMKVQHSLRAFTAKDRKDIKSAAENYPLTDFYKTSDLITQMGIGEAMVTVLNEKGIPTPLVHTMLSAPGSRMDVLNKEEIDALVRHSAIASRYNQIIDRDSAYEMLHRKMDDARDLEDESKNKPKVPSDPKPTARRTEKSAFEKVANSSAGRTIIREVTRGLLGVLGIKTTTRRRNRLF
jgi:uncharacterized protein